MEKPKNEIITEIMQHINKMDISTLYVTLGFVDALVSSPATEENT